MPASGGDVKVADFGLARLYGQQAATNLTQDGITMGTPLYMSPEQVEGRALDPRSDIYSLGVTCYQMFAGEPPFRGESALGIAVQHLRSPPTRLENIRPDLPPAVSRIVHKMLAKNPAERFTTPRELARELRAVSLELFPEQEQDDDFAGWEGDDVTSTVETRRVATGQLAAAMRTSALPLVGRRARARWITAIVACFVVGTLLAWLLRDKPLIAPAADSEEVVPRYDTAAAQYIYASMIDTEPAWRSVQVYFPQDAAYSRRAKQGLALVYLRERKYTRALKLFDEFAALNDAEVQFKAFGLAGQAVVLNRLGQYEQSAERLSKLWPISDQLDRDMRALVGPTLRSNRKSLGETQALKPWQEWFETTPASPAETP
jgi:serine/threonine-protein kinase